MKPRRRLVASLLTALVLVLIAVAWVAFAPTRLGGQVSYVIVNGNSMEPGMHRGDLAIVRESHAYAEGDVVTYRHPQIGPVIHRIVARDGEKYVFKGDHNSVIDGFEPAEADLIGKLWFHVPSAGRAMEPFQDRRLAALLIILALAGLGGGAGAAARKRGKGARPAPLGAEPAGRPVMQSLTRSWEDGLVTLGAAAFALLVLAVLAFGRPVTRTVPDDRSYRQSGTFTYSAASSDGAIYDSAVAVTGEPIFRRLSDTIDVRFNYQFTSKLPAQVRGRQRLVAEVGDGNGWKRTIELQPETPFEGAAFTAEGAVSLGAIETFIRRLEAETGVHNQSYTLSVVPQVTLDASLGGRPIQDTFAPRLAFKLDEFQVALPSRAGQEADPMAPLSDGISRGTRAEANTVNLLFLSPAVSTARWCSLLGLGLVLVGAGAFILGAIRRHRPAGDSPASVHGKYGLPIVTVRGVAAPRTTTIDVASVDDLAKVAERESAVLLQEIRPGYHCYFVQAGPVVYRYQAVGRQAPEGRRGAAA